MNLLKSDKWTFLRLFDKDLLVGQFRFLYDIGPFCPGIATARYRTKCEKQKLFVRLARKPALTQCWRNLLQLVWMLCG